MYRHQKRHPEGTGRADRWRVMQESKPSNLVTLMGTGRTDHEALTIRQPEHSNLLIKVAEAGDFGDKDFTTVGGLAVGAIKTFCWIKSMAALTGFTVFTIGGWEQVIVFHTV